MEWDSNVSGRYYAAHVGRTDWERMYLFNYDEGGRTTPYPLVPIKLKGHSTNAQVRVPKYYILSAFKVQERAKKFLHVLIFSQTSGQVASFLDEFRELSTTFYVHGTALHTRGEYI